MFFGGGLVGLALFALFVYCVIDLISTDEGLVRNLPKMVWLLLVIFVPLVGPMSWLLLGRPEQAGWHPGDRSPRASRRTLGPEDSPEFMSRLDSDDERLRRWEDDLKRREDELRRREKGDD
jgi:hypothetical protein